jgi:hypothetical protein
MYVSILESGVEKGIAWLREAHGMLTNLLEKDEMELEEANNNTRVVETALRAENPHEDWSDRPPSMRPTDSINSTHPMLARLNIPEAQKETIEDYGKNIQSS